MVLWCGVVLLLGGGSATGAASSLFQDRATQKQYLAVVHGLVREDTIVEQAKIAMRTLVAAGTDDSPTACAASSAPPASAGACADDVNGHTSTLSRVVKPLSRAALYRARVAAARKAAAVGGGLDDSAARLVRYCHWPDFVALLAVSAGDDAAVVPSTAPEVRDNSGNSTVTTTSDGDPAWATALFADLVAEEAAGVAAARDSTQRAAVTRAVTCDSAIAVHPLTVEDAGAHLALVVITFNLSR